MLTDDQVYIADQLNVWPSAHNDISLRYETENRDELPFVKWLDAHRTTSPHWFKSEEKPDADNDALYDRAAQSAHVLANGEEATRQLLESHGLKLGQTLTRPKGAEEEKIKTNKATNPFSDAFAGDAAARQKRIAEMIKSLGAGKVAAIARAAGKKLDGTPIK